MLIVVMLTVVMIGVVLLSVVMPSVVKLSVIMLSVMAPYSSVFKLNWQQKKCFEVALILKTPRTDESSKFVENAKCFLFPEWPSKTD
jgi:hypothetical protein